MNGIAMLRATLAGSPVEPGDLRDRNSWRQAFERDGKLADGVIISGCGRYTIVRCEPGLGSPERFQWFRRHGPPEQPWWNPPTQTDVVDTADQARLACWNHAESEAPW